MPFSNTFANLLAKLIWQATPNIANLLDNAATSPITDLYVSLHTADPVAGDQSTSEASYTGYARVAVARTSSGWTVSGAALENVAEILFPARSGGGTPTITHVGIGKSSSGAGVLYACGPLASSLVMAGTMAPRIPAGSLDVALNATA